MSDFYEWMALGPYGWRFQVCGAAACFVVALFLTAWKALSKPNPIEGGTSSRSQPGGAETRNVTPPLLHYCSWAQILPF